MSTLPDWKTLSLPEWVAQMVVVRASGHLFDHQIRYPAWEPPAATLRHWLEDLAVGGVILLGGSAAELGLRSHQLQEWAKIPLLIAADIEEGVGQRFAGATWFPPPLAIAAIAQHNPAKAEFYAEQMGAFTAEEALAIGINWVLAPVVDVNNNPQNPVINVRAFGETPDVVSQLAIGFLRGAQRHPVLTAAKHFPGHGDTATDSHLDLPVLAHAQQRLVEVELPPFERRSPPGVDAVMSAHLQIPTLDKKYPATLSHRILTGELRQRLGFDGLIVTDALVMGAIANRYGANEAPVLAVEAGADILMMPVAPAGAIQAICEAVKSGRIALERIQASVERIWQAKQKVCVPNLEGGTSHDWEHASPPIQLGQLAQPGAIATVAQILRDSMQIYHPANSRLHQSTQTGELRNLILVDDALDCDFLGKHTAAIALPQARGYQTEIVDRYTPKPLLDLAAPARPALLQLFIRGNPFRGSAGQTQTAQDWFQFLLETNQLQALVVYGSPYVLEQFVPSLPADISYVFTYGQMPLAQAIALKQYFDDENH
ncbi:MAG: beta-glucosidase [Leptolyngbyaceae cyanobacterium RM2_2_4]|nr:beta-glucosidase [Leptolyngbyaceae cyanobacterium RM2_2_4]